MEELSASSLSFDEVNRIPECKPMWDDFLDAIEVAEQEHHVEVKT